nr:hypothetical protein HUO10_005984 [Paraburkholderia busanensis]
MDQWNRKFLHLTAIALLWVGSLIGLLIWIGISKTSFFPALLFLTGAVGAVLANYRRLSDLPLSGVNLETAVQQMATVQLWVAPLIGGTFAILLWMLFFTGILQGSLFPTVSGTYQTYNDWYHLMTCTHPQTYADAAKGTVWAFIAGFSEKFVPNVIDRITKESSEAAKTKDIAEKGSKETI